MSSQMPNGARYAIATALSSAIDITAITNASPPVITAATLPSSGDVLFMTSAGWPEFNGAIAVAGAAGALPNFDTSDTDAYPAGEGVPATYQTVTGFTAISKVQNVATAGGEANYYQYQYVEDRTNSQRQVPTFKSVRTFTLTIDYDPSSPHHDVLIAADAARQPTVLRESLVSGDKVYRVGYVVYDGESPTNNLNQFKQNSMAMSLTAIPLRVAAAA